MRKIVWVAVMVACFYGMLSAAKPMEALNRYNVVLVHGAAPENQGYGSLCGETIKDAWNTRNDFIFSMRDTTQDEKLPWNLGDAVGMLGKYEDDDEKKLTLWLDSAVFEDTVTYGSEYIYIQRSFTNPAESPARNAHEIGDRTWKGDNKCSVRRSLFEEAQEVRTEGKYRLQQLRTNSVDEYRTIPSRNILIAHSMGGVASHEYVTDQSVYNDDVDKMITLDSPHEGTGSLNLLLDMRKYGRQLGEATAEYMIWWATAAVIAGVEPVTPTVAAYILAATYGMSTLNRIVTTFVDMGLGEKYSFKEEDSLSKYISPDAEGITSLRNRPYNENLPMVRLLAGKGGMTFSDPNGNYAKYMLNFIIPEALSAPIGNIMTQVIDGDGSATAIYVNSVTGLALGVVGGITLWDVGTTLIPESSGLAEKTKAFKDANADVKTFTFDAAAHANDASMVPLVTSNVVTLGATVSGIIAAHYALAAFPYAQVPAKLGIAFAGAGLLALELYIADAGILDLVESHENAKARRMLDTLYSADFSYTKVKGGNESGRTRLMEDFLYERPFVNLGLFVSDSTLRAVESGCYYEADEANKQQLCEVGLYGADGKVVASNGKKNYSEFRKGDLKFKSESDWSKMGMKVDRWEKVDGLHPDGSDNPGGVPIRHVERYEVPAITVEDWIEKYSFVVDDLMPHRLRQIRMNFNFQEEIAWECDITKPDTSSTACTVYKRSGGGSWDNPVIIVDSADVNGRRVETRRDTIDKVPHPVKKSGQFDFVATDFYRNLLAIQKDNQNTVTISTVNKIGLSNTQRFYYLFKATANMLQPSWPKRDVVVNKIKGFKAYASALGYQGFKADSAKDSIVLQSVDTVITYPLRDMKPEVQWYIDSSLIASGASETGIVYDSSSAYFASNHADENPYEGEYLWKFFVDIKNIADTASKDSSNTYEVPFKVDRTPPAFALASEGAVVNPDSVSFAARFSWTGNGIPDIRAMRLALKKMDGDSLNRCKTRVADFPAMADVASKEFAIQWNSVTRDAIRSKGDGNYCIEAYAVDYAVPDSAVYGKMVDLVDAISSHPGSIADTLWPDSNDFINSSVVFDSFFVDTRAPVMSDGAMRGSSTSASAYSALSRPARNNAYDYATEDSLLEISYKLTESLGGRDSILVTVAWNFIHLDDTTKVDHAGDSVWVKNGDIVNASWTEMSGMRLEDGDYRIHAHVRDAAGNASAYDFSKKLRVDKTAPYIESLVSTKLVYPDSDKVYSAKIVVDERYDVETSRTGVYCHYRIGGCGNTTGWKRIPDNALKKDSVTFALDSLEGRHGKCYLEAACIDAAGNATVKTDLFYMGERTPAITSPYNNRATTELVAITGIAPPYRLADSLNTIYRLRYANVESLGADGELVWETSGISVVSALQNDKYRNVSRVSQSNEAVLGYLDRNLGNDNYLEGTYIIELGTCAAAADSICVDGPDSQWVTDTAWVDLEMIDSAGVKHHFVVNPKDSLTVGKDTLDVSLHLSGLFNSSYMMRVYAKDAAGVGMFDESVSKAWRNPYYGAPNDTSSGKSAVWFYEQEDGYHLQWKGLAAGDTLEVAYDSLGFGHTCEGPGGNNAQNCETQQHDYGMVALPTPSGQYFEDFPELRPLSSVNSKMLLTGNEGHVVMTATAAFHVSQVNAFADTFLPKMKVYFGEKENDGFYWVADGLVSSDTLNPLTVGWTVDPRAYGISFRWAGPESGRFPAEGNMTVYAEITENIANNPYVIRDSVKVKVKLPELEIVLPDTTLPDFTLMEKDTALVCADETTPDSLCERRAFKLGSMVAKYGVKYRDAKVRACIMDATGDCIAVLQDTTKTMRANVSDSAYQVRWDGKIKGTSVAEEGLYTLKITAYPANATDTAVSAEATFHVKHAETMRDLTPANPKNPHNTVPAIYVSEANPDYGNPGMYRYEPTADYLVKANIGGWMLPDSSLVDGIPLKGEISGTQQILKYEPKRFSLAIKRHRKELKLVIMAKLDVATVFANCYGEGVHEDNDKRIFYFLRKFTFDGAHRTGSFDINKHIGNIGSGRGLSGERYNYLTVYAFLDNQVKEYAEKDGEESIPIDTTQITPIWSKTFSLPMQSDDNRYSKETVPFVFEKDFVGCLVVDDSTTCVYGPSDNLNNSSGYDPNKKLFNVSLNPVNGVFYTGMGEVHNDCWYNDAARNERIKFNLSLEIPDTAYWNAPFGMDNLVNRTVRFDHTNTTIFGEGESGYWKALDSYGRIGVGTYYDGNTWKKDKTYGLLTPFEVQYLPMYPASVMGGGENTFLFADEDKDHPQDARFDLHFYSPRYDLDYFQAAVVSDAVVQHCDTIAPANFKRSNNSANKCIVYATSNDDTVRNTPYYSGTDSVVFYVGRNKALGTVTVDSIAYPATANWQQYVKESCKATDEEWKFTDNGTVSCYKYYDFASRAHYYYGDYSDSVWTARMVRGDSVIKNMVNSTEIASAKSLEALFRDSVDVSKFGNKKLEFPVQLSSRNFDADSSRFFVKFDSVTTVLSNLVGDKVDASISNLGVDSAKISGGISSIRLSATNDTLYVKADSLKEDIIYRKSEDSLAKTPVRPNSVALSMKRLYRNDNEWVKNVVTNSAVLEQLDSSAHTHLNINGQFPSSSDMTIGFKSIDSIEAKRPKELVELRAYLKKNYTYDVAYLNDTAFYVIPGPMLDSIKWKNGVKLDSNDEEGWYRLGWFDVNKLQGNTQFMLLWGDSLAYNFAEFKMIVGRAVEPTSGNTVKSLFEEASVTFPKNSVETVKNVTVRTVEASDYSFEVFNNLALKGPIVEVLPRMTFADTARPRIQMKISYEEMEAMHATPQTVRLYKVDFVNKQFVPLTDVLYGYLDKYGKALVEGASDTVATCSTATDIRCYTDKEQWAYLLISAETRTFSVFTAMASRIAETPSFSVTVLPKIASTANRTVRVDGISRFRLYVDDDSLWANRGDVTPPDTLAFTADSNGFARIALPSRGNAIDTSYVFVVALGEPDAEGNMEELPAAPAVARVLTVNAQFACSVPQDSLWLGLDNGYMAYGASCTHPGYGLVSLYREGKVIAEIRGEIPDTVIYDGFKTSGASGLGKIASGIYESRYVGVSALGMDMQMAGPRVYTDSARPAIRNFSVQDSSEVLDRIFTATADVYDSESGIARVVVTPVFGGDTLRVMNVVPDSAGHVSASIRISRKQLAECTGCYLSMEVRVEDYGHNHAEQGYVSDEKLYPYPTELALWYPAREGGGRLVHELLGTGHDLDLFKKMGGPWGSDAGLYFSKSTDYIYGNGTVDFGSTNSYSFEARIKPGNPNDNAWHEILSFKGVNALDIRLLQNKRALMLVEGSHNWKTGSILPVTNKSWSHVVVTVDSDSVKFYVDGESKAARNSGISLEREMEGVFSMGKAGSEPSYIGNIADIRMYSRALTAAEVEELSKPVTDVGEVSDVIVIAVKDMEAVSGFSNEFSCSVAGNKYLVSGDSATLTMSVIVENAADYNVVLYARSATVGDKSIYVGESNLLTGTASVSNTWRAVTVSDVSIHLAAGAHTLMLKVSAGVQIGGAALTTANIPASMIAWGISTSDKVAGIVPADTARKVKSYLRYEGYPESSTLRPRIRLRNVSNEPVNGFSVRYYFRGEDASQAGVDRYWPNYGPTFPAVHSESANTGYVEWTFAETIPVAGTVFGGSGPHFGLYNSDFTPWSASDDPSFVDPNSGLVANIDGFYEDAGIVVLDNDNNLIGGSCAEMEDPVSLETKVRVLAADVRGDKLASEIHFNVENTGNVSLKNFDVRYYFFVEEGLAPDYELNDKSKCSSASMESLGSGRWQVTVHCDSSLAAGNTWQNPVKFALHLPGWPAMWNADDDPSHDSLGMTIRVARGICVFDSTGYMLYGNTPVWALPAPDEVNPDSVYNVDFGYRAPGNSIPVIRTPEGLVVTMDNWSYVELSLVTALGTPVKSIFSGTLAPGDQLVHVDWTGIDMNRTYLMLKVNGTIKSTKKLSLL